MKTMDTILFAKVVSLMCVKKRVLKKKTVTVKTSRIRH